ncbi:MAG: class B sortase [Oscillospiraceae bacterium]|nr:class B sortase [Oscillospiraceae bacterium]
MSMSDEIRANPRYKTVQKKKKKSFSEQFIPMKGDKPNEIMSKIIVLLSIAALIVCGVILAVHFYHIFEAKQNNENIKVIYNQIQQSASSGGATGADPSVTPDDGTEEAERSPLVLLPFAEEMLAINPDYVGYVSIPGRVSEAVVQSTDNDYYLKKNFYGQTRSCGTVFADFRAVVSDYADRQSDNIVLYGHNQRDGTMFGELDYYKWDPKYWLQNPFIYFDNKYEQSTYVIIASFVINTEPEHDNGYVFDYHNYTNFNEKHPFETFKKEITQRSQFLTGIDFDENDKYITLSTCSYEWEPARHVIIGRKLRSGETTESIDTTAFEVNPNPKWPAVYYKYNGGTYVETSE